MPSVPWQHTASSELPVFAMRYGMPAACNAAIVLAGRGADPSAGNSTLTASSLAPPAHPGAVTEPLDRLRDLEGGLFEGVVNLGGGGGWDDHAAEE